MKQNNVDSKSVRIISNLYRHQIARVRVDGSLGGDVEIYRGIRQGCVLYPFLFNTHSEGIYEKAFSEKRRIDTMKQ